MKVAKFASLAVVAVLGACVMAPSAFAVPVEKTDGVEDGISSVIADNNTADDINSNEENQTGNSCGGVNTSIINCNEGDDNKGGGIFGILLIVLNVLTFGIGIAGTLGIVIAGVMYLTARDNEAQMVKAKNMLLNVVIGLVAYALLWAFLQWLIPGGIIGG